MKEACIRGKDGREENLFDAIKLENSDEREGKERGWGLVKEAGRFARIV